MTPEQLLLDALRSAEPSEAGIAELDARVGAAEKGLTAAGGVLSACEDERSDLIDRQSTVNARLAALKAELRKARPANSATVLEALAHEPRQSTTVLANLAVQSRLVTDQIALLHQVLEHIVTVLLPTIAIRTTQAQIALAVAAHQWVTAKAHHDLMGLQLKLIPAMSHDRTLTINVGEGSHAHVFAQRLNSFSLEIATLEDRLQHETAIAQKYQQTLEVV